MEQSTLALLASLGSLILTAIAIYRAIKLAPREVKQSDVDILSKYASATGVAIDQLRGTLDELGKYTDKFDVCRELVDNLYEGIDILIEQLEKGGIEPKWKPPGRASKS